MTEHPGKTIEDEYKQYIAQVYHVFAETEHGKYLLERWKKSYFFRPICLENEPVESAKRDGENRFIRDILIAIEQFKKLLESNDGRSNSNR